MSNTDVTRDHPAMPLAPIDSAGVSPVLAFLNTESKAPNVGVGYPIVD